MVANMLFMVPQSQFNFDQIHHNLLIDIHIMHYAVEHSADNLFKVIQTQTEACSRYLHLEEYQLAAEW